MTLSSETSVVIGVDFGTDSVRALLVDAKTGHQLTSEVCIYPRWQRGDFCQPHLDQYRQHPLDYIEGLENVITLALQHAPEGTASQVVGLSIGTTGSTVVAVDQQGTPLSLLAEFAQNPNAMFLLWEDHTAIQEAEEINQLAHRWQVDYTQYVGETYSSEWFWAKILHVLRHDPAVASRAYSWVEHCDWIGAYLAGNTDPVTMKRSRCAAGHKAMWHADYDGLPDQVFLTALDSRLSGIRKRLFKTTATSDQAVGTLSAEWANRLGLPTTVKIGVGAIDAHMGAVGASIQPYTLVKVMGTSTCDMLIAPNHLFSEQRILGICGQVDGSIIPGMVGMEAGQSAFGDLYAWFRRLLCYPLTTLLPHLVDPEQVAQLEQSILTRLAEQAAQLPISEHDPVALDWINGRRTPDADQSLTGAITGLRLGTEAPQLFKALVEATAFGSRAILDCFQQQGVPIHKITAIGGIARKSSYVIQTLANVLNLPISVLPIEQPCALGAAMFASVVAGVYGSLEEAIGVMGLEAERIYQPDPGCKDAYNVLYARYQQLGNHLT